MKRKGSRVYNFIPGAAVCLLALLASGCATIFNGKTQKVQVVTDPPGATATATATAGGESVTTAGFLRLPRKAKDLEIRVEKDGFVAKTIRLERRVSGVVWANLGWMVAGVGIAAAAAEASILDAGTTGDDNNSGDAAAIGGLPAGGAGFAIDFASGAAYRLVPATVVVKLEPSGGAAAGPR